MRRGMLLLAAGSGLTAIAAGGSGNSANDSLLAISPDQRAEMLTKGIKGCIGNIALSDGVTTTGKAEGYAYWSVRWQGRQKLCRSNHTELQGDRGGLQGAGRLRQRALQQNRCTSYVGSIATTLYRDRRNGRIRHGVLCFTNSPIAH
jgi:hypothetical protein